MNTLSIIGCGQLGLPVAIEGLERGLSVKGSSTSEEGCKRLRSKGISPILFSTDNPDTPKETYKELWDAEIVVITIPFRKNLENPFDYPKQLTHILSYITDKTKLVVMTSSTSVYPDMTIPNGISVWTEDDKITSETPRRKALLDTEKEILKTENSDRKAVVLRLAGLISPTRHPGKWARTEAVINHPDVRVNLVHQDDVVRFIWAVIDRNAEGIFNVCADDHPTKREFYTKAAKQMKLAIPKFSEDEALISSKIVSNTKGKEKLSFTYDFSSPMQMLF